jgi:xanthine dehydrogenase accessory factor
MRELYAILDAWRGLEAHDGDPVLATVVHVTGSTYRRPGARMLLFSGGRRIGCISGGCLEGEIVRKAWWLTESGAPAVVVYDTSADEDAAWEFGLGCNGAVHVMLERVNAPAVRDMLGYLDARRAARKAAVVVTVVRQDGPSAVQVGDRLLCDGFQAPAGSLIGSVLEAPATLHAAAALREKRSRLVHLGTADLFVEWIGRPLSLVVFGAGHDAIPLVSFAGLLGWDVTVADGRPAYARADRFPGAVRVISPAAGDPLRDIEINEDTAVLLMTHNYPLDLRLLPRILPQRPRYLGLLGPRQRGERLFAELGVSPPACIHSPAGLDAGGDTPEAIALSIVAEIQAATNSRAGGKLRLRQDALHTAAYEVGEISPEPARETVRPASCGV